MDDFEAYIADVAEARYVIRRVFRIIDEQVKRRSLDPLAHQALIQIYGSPLQSLRVNSLAERLAIPAAFASRIVRNLEERGYVTKESSANDRRVTEVHMTGAGREVIKDINQAIRLHIEYFQAQLDPDVKLAALSIFAFYVGLELSPEDYKDLIKRPR